MIESLMSLSFRYGLAVTSLVFVKEIDGVGPRAIYLVLMVHPIVFYLFGKIRENTKKGKVKAYQVDPITH